MRRRRKKRRRRQRKKRMMSSFVHDIDNVNTNGHSIPPDIAHAAVTNARTDSEMTAGALCLERCMPRELAELVQLSVTSSKSMMNSSTAPLRMT